MTAIASPTRLSALSRALLVDAAGSGATGLLLAAGNGALAEPLGIPSGWLLGLGVFMLAYAAELLVVARMLPRTAGWVRWFAIGNTGWVLASVGAVVLGAWDLTGLGVAFVLAQAAAVAGFVAMQVRAASTA
ncbi:hypothetical protein DVS28_a0418 [Euzebya pacifica]|uniref:Integral membrane protein n=1 Tax=Euzebya pacifica TaxID=1608957 RepID=A0A346XSC8_9ACTN|nr:hypothetical protein [Euzebya pacifica]AXV05125.1 hypothetical protein DVS28_a0418 [Euzebya pacifica]